MKPRHQLIHQHRRPIHQTIIKRHEAPFLILGTALFGLCGYPPYRAARQGWNAVGTTSSHRAVSKLGLILSRLRNAN